jgi:hypothetical protein
MKPQYIEITRRGIKLYFSDREMTILHREDGPAFEHIDGSKSWYLNGKYVSEDEHTRRTAKEIILTIDEIAAKFGVDVSKLKITK